MRVLDGRETQPDMTAAIYARKSTEQDLSDEEKSVAMILMLVLGR